MYDSGESGAAGAAEAGGALKAATVQWPSGQVIVCPMWAAMSRVAVGKGKAPAAAPDFTVARESPPPKLTDTEQRVIELMAQGLSNAAIASRLYVSVNTVKTHVRSIFHKLGVHNRSMAVAYALASGIIDISSSLIHLVGSPVQAVHERPE